MQLFCDSGMKIMENVTLFDVLGSYDFAKLFKDVQA